jgi:hypothetical protein
MARTVTIDGVKRGARVVQDRNGILRSRTQIKYCTECRRYHPIDQFRKDPKKIDGLSTKCAKVLRNKEAEYRRTKETKDQWGAEADRQYEYRWDNRAYYKMYVRYRYLKKQVEEIDRDERYVGLRGGSGFIRGALVKEMREIRRTIGTPTGKRKSRLK